MFSDLYNKSTLFQCESVIESIYLVFPRKTPSGLSIGITLKTIDFRSSLAIPCLLVRNSIIPISKEDERSYQSCWQ